MPKWCPTKNTRASLRVPLLWPPMLTTSKYGPTTCCSAPMRRVDCVSSAQPRRDQLPQKRVRTNWYQLEPSSYQLVKAGYLLVPVRCQLVPARYQLVSAGHQLVPCWYPAVTSGYHGQRPWPLPRPARGQGPMAMAPGQSHMTMSHDKGQPRGMPMGHGQ